MDALSAVLRSLSLRGTVYFQADMGAPWGLDMRRGEVASFHIIVDGSCWLRHEGQPLRLSRGDLVLFPRGDAHQLAHTEDGAAQPARPLLCALRERGSLGGPGPRTTLICGHFEHDRDVGHPLLDALPSRVHLRRGEGHDPAWLATATGLVVAESGRSGEPGASAVIDRLAEVLMIQVLRAWARDQDQSDALLAGLAEPGVGQALAAMHREPHTAWTLDALARRAGMSRSSFAARFSSLLGTAPMQYLTRWRMVRTRQLIANTDRTLAEIALEVGYGSEFSLAKAFKRSFGVPPGEIRRRARAG